jgi:hypothetical protein
MIIMKQTPMSKTVAKFEIMAKITLFQVLTPRFSQKISLGSGALSHLHLLSCEIQHEKIVWKNLLRNPA